MQVLAIHRYYWPDTPPYASLLRAIVARWAEDGHDVEVLSSQPSYKPEAELHRRPRIERVDQAAVRRISMRPDRGGRGRRGLNVVKFPLVVALRLLVGKRYDVVMCSTAPPVLLAAAASYVARMRGARFIYHCMDLHPEIGAISGEFAHPKVFRLLRRVDTATCRRAACVVVLSQDMRAALLNRDPALADKVVVLNNFELPDFGEPREPVNEADAHPGMDASTPVRIAFAGNLGRYQGLEVLTRALLTPDPRLDQIELVFMGEGSVKTELQRLVAQAPPAIRHRIEFRPHGSPGAARSLLRTADLGLVSLAPKVIEFAYPSKTATYLAEGLPLLVAVESSSELARMVTEQQVGWHLPVDDERTARECLLSVVEERPRLSYMRTRARALWSRDFAATVQLPRWSRLLDDLRRAG